MNDFDVLDDLERELGPSLRHSLRRAAAEVTDELGHDHTAAAVVDMRSTRVERRRRRPWLLAVATAAAVIVLAVTAVVQTTKDGTIRTPASSGAHNRVQLTLCARVVDDVPDRPVDITVRRNDKKRSTTATIATIELQPHDLPVDPLWTYYEGCTDQGTLRSGLYTLTETPPGSGSWQASVECFESRERNVPIPLESIDHTRRTAQVTLRGDATTCRFHNVHDVGQRRELAAEHPRRGGAPALSRVDETTVSR